MNSLSESIASSKYAKALRDECLETIPMRRYREILLLSWFLGVFAIIVIYLWVNGLVYDFWFYIMLGIVCLIVLGGYLMDRKYRPDWAKYFQEIIEELKVIDTIELSDYINEGQPFLGANLGNCEKFLSIAEKFLEKNVMELVIRGPKVYLKGFEPPIEETKKESDEKNGQ